MGQYLKGVDDIMAEIINLNNLELKQNENLKTSLSEEETLVKEAFSFIFSMPDDLFRQIYPSMKEEFLKTIKSGEYQKEQIEKGSSQEEIDRSLQSLLSIKKEIDNYEGLSKEKIEYLNLIIDETINILLNIPYRDKVKVQVEFCHPNAKEPTYANPDDAGCDIYAVENCDIAPGTTVIVKTGLKVAVPAGWVLTIYPRSGLSAKSGLRLANSVGQIDTGYRDEIGVIFHNTSSEIYTIKTGDRIAQFRIEPAPMIEFEKVDSVEEIGRNRGGGFGHSGN